MTSNFDLAELIGRLLDWIAPFVPPALGAAVGLLYKRDLTNRERASAFVVSFLMGIYLGAGVGEWLALGPKATIAVGVMIAAVGTEAIGVLIAALRQFKTDPAGAFRRWLDAWLGRGGGTP